MYKFKFKCESCQGENEPCILIIEIKENKCNLPDECPYKSYTPEWKAFLDE